MPCHINVTAPVFVFLLKNRTLKNWAEYLRCQHGDGASPLKKTVNQSERDVVKKQQFYKAGASTPQLSEMQHNCHSHIRIQCLVFSVTENAHGQKNAFIFTAVTASNDSADNIV